MELFPVWFFVILYKSMQPFRLSYGIKDGGNSLGISIETGDAETVLETYGLMVYLSLIHI